MESVFVPVRMDLAVDAPLESDAAWAIAWTWANAEIAGRGVIAACMPPKEEVYVLVTKQTRPAENGPWLVRSDGSRRRPPEFAYGTALALGALFVHRAGAPDQAAAEVVAKR